MGITYWFCGLEKYEIEISFRHISLLSRLSLFILQLKGTK